MADMTDSKTAFLRETTTWTDRHGNTHQLTDMTESYLRHVLSFLEERAEIYFDAELDESITQAMEQQTVAFFEPWLHPNPQPPAVLEFGSAHDWLESKPLVRAIRALLGEPESRTQH